MSNDLASQLVSIFSSNPKEALIAPFHFDQAKNNELLFFFKPECFIAKTQADFTAISQMVLKKFTERQVSISGALLLNGARLDEFSIMDRHYGFINTLSRQASTLLTDKEAEFIQQSLQIDLREYAVLGGHEFLARYNAYDHNSLNDLWLSKKSVKLRSGFYIQSYAVNGDKVVLVNGFHPSQLAHFTDPTHKIIVLLAESDTPWRSLKDDLAGDTYPERSNPASIRGELFKNKSLYHADNIAISNNYIHLSAGPYEALFEIRNFLSQLDQTHFDVLKTNLASRMLAAGLQPADIDRALTNPTTVVEGKPTDLFTLTENLDTPEAVEGYVRLFKASNLA
jgi:hypothetical protein